MDIYCYSDKKIKHVVVAFKLSQYRKGFGH